MIVRVEAVAERAESPLRDYERERIERAVREVFGRKIQVIIVARAPASEEASAAGRQVAAEVGRAHGIAADALLGDSRVHEVSRARHEVWWLLAERGLDIGAIAAAFGRTKATVSEALTRFRALLEIDAELRARLTWAAAEWRRRAA